jgi:hypothetical protein
LSAEQGSAWKGSCAFVSTFFSFSLLTRSLVHSEDTSNVVVAAGVDDLWLSLPVADAKKMTEKRIAITKSWPPISFSQASPSHLFSSLAEKLDFIGESIARQEEEHALVRRTLFPSAHRACLTFSLLQVSRALQQALQSQQPTSA